MSGVIRNLTASLLQDTAPTEGPAEEHAPNLPQHSQTATDIVHFVLAEVVLY